MFGVKAALAFISGLMATVVLNDLFQLTPEAERKVVQSRELLDTIVKENKGCNMNKVGPLQHDPAAAK